MDNDEDGKVLYILICITHYHSSAKKIFSRAFRVNQCHFGLKKKIHSSMTQCKVLNNFSCVTHIIHSPYFDLINILIEYAAIQALLAHC